MHCGVEVYVFWCCATILAFLYSAAVVSLAALDFYIICFICTCILFGIVFYFRLPKPSAAVVDNILGPKWGAFSDNKDKDGGTSQDVKIISHKGCGLDAPENSITALNKIIDEGIRVVKFDIILTQDDIPVVFHDEDLSRMTKCEGRVSQTSYQDLQQLDISEKHPFGFQFSNERIPTLQEYVDLCLKHNVKMILDVKSDYRYAFKLADHIINFFNRTPTLYDSAMIASFNPFIIYYIHSKAPKIVCGLAWQPYYHSYINYSSLTGPTVPRYNNPVQMLYGRLLDVTYDWTIWNIGYYILGISAILLHKDVANGQTIEHWKKLGVRVLVWTVNLPAEKQYFEKVLQVPYLTDTVINS